ncbi:polysaccharide deacetylase family protein [Nitrosomonas sp.]|uniref:polysaccharide deacetylase family protein n=1 Tax=Nitrosomonas sp. TaxID=42353 RepID=UPI002611400B|nr:polysaccharide deacetylase family protein [Nitrosomonas sp.]MCW5600496.1 polysaccharide deacetylase family protein [Nitrosomonas sp.]
MIQLGNRATSNILRENQNGMKGVNRIVVFTGDPNYSVCKGIVEIDRAISNLYWLIVVYSPRKSLQQLLRNQLLNMRRNGWRWIPYQAIDIFQRVFLKALNFIQTDSFNNEYTISTLEKNINFQILRVREIHENATLSIVKQFGPSLGISLAAPILRRSLFSIPLLGTINLHKGKLPDYRGMPPAFWELWNSEKFVGCTIHWVNDKLDAGEIVLENMIEIEPYSTLRGLQISLDELGIQLMREAVALIIKGKSLGTPQSVGGKTYRKPTLSEVALLNKKLESRQNQNIGLSRVNRAIKNTLSSIIFTSWRLGAYRLFLPRITILLYHRVTDSVRDNLTVGIEQFDRQMSLLHRYCQPLSIEEVLSCQTIPRTNRPLVSITFDDGYYDNYQNAMPILLKYGMPAAFFVSTGLIGTKEQFPHDVRRGNSYIPIMDWQQLREMRQKGFIIGSHTVNHIDCATESEGAVWAELIQSRDDLLRELGQKEAIFAYPYGGRQHMTSERLKLVKDAGYLGCLSAYGGSNVGKIDVFDVRRCGIHWEFSDKAFLRTCLGLR